MPTSTGHTFDYDAAQVAVVSAKLLAEDAYLSALVSHDFQDEFLAPGTAGRPIKIKFPTILLPRERDIDDVTTSIELDAIVEAGTTLNLDKKMVYSAVPLSEADLNLNLADVSRQVIRPQAKGIAEDIEDRLATKLLSVADATGMPAYDPANPVRFYSGLRKVLRDRGIPQDSLNLVIGTGLYLDLLNAKAIQDASASGSTAALREGSVGRVAGFTVVESTRVEEFELLAFHKSSVTLVTRAPAVPSGASFGETVNEGGYSIRYMRDYDADKTVDRSILATFVGVGILPTFKKVVNKATRKVTFEEVANGGIIHVKDVSSLIAVGE
ncbi:major capsid protein [Microbacterium phage Percival]|uniref:Major capsid protein n=1 Tax=Microbacterium phage Percival TaxID=2201439 RepID=A0A2Z4Q739_9CAUD|nr:major capsid protein [Microbacterium phage Percival]